jgi:CBS domain-containing protein
MRAAELMSRTVATVRTHDTLHHAVSLMRERDCGCVVVIDERSHAIAVLTDRDVSLAALRTGRALGGIEVGDAMSKKLHACRTDDTIAAVEDLMALHQVRRLPVVDAQGRLAGILALDDVAREAIREEDLIAPPVSAAAVGATLGRICRPHLIEEAGA